MNDTSRTAAPSNERRHYTNDHQIRRSDEAGSSLILALVFLIVVGLIAISMVSWVGNDLINVVTFATARSTQTAADAAVETAIQNARYNFSLQDLQPSSPQPCWTTSPTPSQIVLNSQTVDVWCSTQYYPISNSTRIETFYSCLNTVATGALCAATPLLTVKVSFDDNPSTFGASNCAPGSAGASTCGTGMTVNSWRFNA